MPSPRNFNNNNNLNERIDSSQLQYTNRQIVLLEEFSYNYTLVFIDPDTQTIVDTLPLDESFNQKFNSELNALIYFAANSSFFIIENNNGQYMDYIHSFDATTGLHDKIIRQTFASPGPVINTMALSPDGPSASNASLFFLEYTSFFTNTLYVTYLDGGLPSGFTSPEPVISGYPAFSTAAPGIMDCTDDGDLCFVTVSEDFTIVKSPQPQPAPSYDQGAFNPSDSNNARSTIYVENNEQFLTFDAVLKLFFSTQRSNTSSTAPVDAYVPDDSIPNKPYMTTYPDGSDDVVWVIGNGGTIYRFTYGGYNFSNIVDSIDLNSDAQYRGIAFIPAPEPLTPPDIVNNRLLRVVFGDTPGFSIVSNVTKSLTTTTALYGDFNTTASSVGFPEAWNKRQGQDGTNYLYSYSAQLTASTQLTIQYAHDPTVEQSVSLPDGTVLTLPIGAVKFSLNIDGAALSDLFQDSATGTLSWSACFQSNQTFGNAHQVQIKSVKEGSATTHTISGPLASFRVRIPDIASADGVIMPVEHNISYGTYGSQGAAQVCAIWTFPHFTTSLIYDPDLSVLAGESESGDGGDGSSSNWIIGAIVAPIVVGLCLCIVVVVIMALILAWIIKRRRRDRILDLGENDYRGSVNLSQGDMRDQL